MQRCETVHGDRRLYEVARGPCGIRLEHRESVCARPQSSNVNASVNGEEPRDNCKRIACTPAYSGATEEQLRRLKLTRRLPTSKNTPARYTQGVESCKDSRWLLCVAPPALDTRSLELLNQQVEDRASFWTLQGALEEEAQPTPDSEVHATCVLAGTLRS